MNTLPQPQKDIRIDSIGGSLAELIDSPSKYLR